VQDLEKSTEKGSPGGAPLKGMKREQKEELRKALWKPSRVDGSEIKKVGSEGRGGPGCRRKKKKSKDRHGPPEAH